MIASSCFINTKFIIIEHINCICVSLPPSNSSIFLYVYIVCVCVCVCVCPPYYCLLKVFVTFIAITMPQWMLILYCSSHLVLEHMMLSIPCVCFHCTLTTAKSAYLEQVYIVHTYSQSSCTDLEELSRTEYEYIFCTYMQRSQINS